MQCLNNKNNNIIITIQSIDTAGIFVLMEQTCNYLFVYGTLLDADNEFARYLNNNCTFYGNGKFKGRLYDIGEYPGAIADQNYHYYVYGNIFALNNSSKVLKYFDDYEGYDDEQDQPDLFIRRMMDIETVNGIVNCWVYLYSLPVNRFKLIESGNYVSYKNKKSS